MDINRKKLVKLSVMLVIILGSALTLGLKFYMDSQALSVDRLSFIKKAPNNQAAILFGNSIFFINSFNKTTSVFNFDDNNLKLQGDFDFFSNGDLLVYSNKEEATLLQNIKTYVREQDTRDDKTTGDNGFYRCHIQTKTCQKFITNLPAFHSTFRLVIDRQTDTLYLADTPSFVLYKVNSDGILVAQNSDNLHFPNQLHFQNNALYVANTNKHSIKVVETATEHFGKEIKSHASIIDSNHRWPSEVIKTPNGWWVGIADVSMSKGWIQVFDEQWNKQKQIIPANPDADVWALATLGNNVLMSDWSNFKIYRFSFSGEQQDDLDNAELNAAFEKSRQHVKRYNELSQYALIAFGIVFVFGIIAALILEKKETIALFNKKDNDITPAIDDKDMLMPPGKDVYWIEAKYRKYRKPLLIFNTIGILYLTWYFSVVFTGNFQQEDFASTAIIYLLIPFFILMAWSWDRISNVKIGVSGHLLLIDDGRGHISAGKNASIKYTQNTLLIGNLAVILGQPRSPLFPKDELSKWVKPRMLLGEKISPWAMFKALWGIRHPYIAMVAGAIIYSIIAIILQQFL